MFGDRRNLEYVGDHELSSSMFGVFVQQLVQYSSGFGAEFSKKVLLVLSQLVGPLLWTASGLVTSENDAPVRKGLLFCEGVRVVVPSGLNELRKDVLTAGIGLGNHDRFLLTGIGRKWTSTG